MYGEESAGASFFVPVPSGGLVGIFETLFQVGNERHHGAVGRIPSNAGGYDCVIDGLALWFRWMSRSWGQWRGGAFVGLKVRFAHAVKVALRLLGASLYFAGAWLGAMALAEALRLDNVGATGRTAVATLVLEFLGRLFAQRKMGIHGSSSRH